MHNDSSPLLVLTDKQRTEIAMALRHWADTLRLDALDLKTSGRVGLNHVPPEVARDARDAERGQLVWLIADFESRAVLSEALAEEIECAELIEVRS